MPMCITVVTYFGLFETVTKALKISLGITACCPTTNKYQSSIRTLSDRAVAPVEPSAILNSGTSPVKLALNVTMMEKSPLKPPDNRK